MIRYMVHPDGIFWRAHADDGLLLIYTGKIGDLAEPTPVDTWEEKKTPPEDCLDDYAQQMLAEGFTFAPIPDVHIEIEKAHGVTLPEPVRTFYATNAYFPYQNFYSQSLECEVDFVSDAVLGNYFEEHYDGEREEHRTFVPISAKIFDGYEDEQPWIGIDPEEDNGPIYALYTSGEFDQAFDNLDAFLADLVKR